MPVELVTIAVAVVLSALSEAALGVLAANRFRDDATTSENPARLQ
jgi:hypothetical protein